MDYGVAIAAVPSFIQDYWWLAAILVLMIAMVVYARRNRVVQRDPKRLFTSAERGEASRRAGGRCEYKHPLWFRCRRPGAHGDHVYPWSKGGATSMGNHQWLCVPHNLRKSDRVPSKIYMWRLYRRRRRYFPEGVDPRIDWRIRL